MSTTAGAQMDGTSDVLNILQSLQLPFAAVPVLVLGHSRRLMGPHATSAATAAVGAALVVALLACNGYLVAHAGARWVASRWVPALVCVYVACVPLPLTRRAKLLPSPSLARGLRTRRARARSSVCFGLRRTAQRVESDAPVHCSWTLSHPSPSPSQALASHSARRLSHTLKTNSLALSVSRTQLGENGGHGGGRHGVRGAAGGGDARAAATLVGGRRGPALTSPAEQPAAEQPS